MATGNDLILESLGMAHLGSPKALLGKKGGRMLEALRTTTTLSKPPWVNNRQAADRDHDLPRRRETQLLACLDASGTARRPHLLDNSLSFCLYALRR